MALKYDCTECKKQITGTKNSRYRSHSNGDGDPCVMSSEPIPEHVLAQPVGADDAPDVPREGIDYAVCPQCERKVELTRLGYFKPHTTILMGGEQCEVSGVRYKHARRTEDVVLPGDEPKPMSVTRPAVSAQKEVIRDLAAKVREESSPESTPTSETSDDPAPGTPTPASKPRRAGLGTYRSRPPSRTIHRPEEAPACPNSNPAAACAAASVRRR